MRTPDCVLDGEVVAIGEDGRATFSAMQRGAAGTTFVYVAFDVLEVEGKPHVDLPLTERRERLGALLDRRRGAIQLSEAFKDGDALFARPQAAGLRGHHGQAGRLAPTARADAPGSG